MIDLKKFPDGIGIFHLNQLDEETKRDEIKAWMLEKQFVIFSLCRKTKEHPAIKDAERRRNETYKGIVIICSPEGLLNLKERFHRSLSFISDLIMRHNDVDCVFQGNQHAIDLWTEVKEKFKSPHVKGVKEIVLRQKSETK